MVRGMLVMVNMIVMLVNQEFKIWNNNIGFGFIINIACIYVSILTRDMSENVLIIN